MAATTTRLIHLRPVLRHHPSTLRHFSSDPAEPQPDPQPEPTPKKRTQTPFSSYLNEVKASLQKEPPPQNRHHQPFSFPKPSPNTAPPPPSKSSSLEEIRRHLSEYRKSSTADARPPTTTPPQLSFQELYKKNVTSRSEAVKPPSFDAIRQSLSKIKAPKPVDPMSLSGYQETLRMKPESDSRMVIGGSVGGDSLSSSLFGKEKQKGGSEKNDTKMATLRLYSFQELGGKLKMLRPDKKKWKSFTLQELKDRLVILSDIEAQKSERNSGGLPYTELRDSLMKMRMSAEEKEREQTMQRLDMLSSLGETPSFMLSPPKEHLVEKYFHPDNMSSAEKLKLELKKVRDEFKMSESDCGSARVQVAQLTTKIKHLSTVLQKKDKHSRKGLQAMVQRRKKLLKYLRRTDWDSYSLVLSKLGLRDNADIKA